MWSVAHRVNSTQRYRKPTNIEKWLYWLKHCQAELDQTDPHQAVKGSVGLQLFLGRKKATSLLKAHILIPFSKMVRKFTAKGRYLCGRSQAL